MKRFASLAAAATVALSLVGLAPAAASSASATDPNDTAVARLDILSISASYTPDLVTLTVQVEEPVDPVVWPKSYSMLWGVDANLDGLRDYNVTVVGGTGRPRPFVTVMDARTNVLTCSDSRNPADPVAYGFDGTAVTVTFPPSCIKSPSGFQLVGGGTTDGGPYATDFDLGPSVCCKVFSHPSGTSSHSGYWMLTGTGSVHRFGSAGDHGSDVASGVKRTHIEPTPSGNGYWILAESGAVHAKGDAKWHGSALTKLAPNETAESLSATSGGYWIFTSRGRVFAFGNAYHYGDMSGTPLNGSILGSVATSSGKGYWMVGSDGGVFSFGDATFYGSTGGMKLNKPVMALAADPDGTGYWLVASDGGIFAYQADFYGSMGATPLNKPISGMVPGTGGYMMVAEDGGIFSFGKVAFHGSLGANPPPSPVVSVALQP